MTAEGITSIINRHPGFSYIAPHSDIAAKITGILFGLPDPMKQHVNAGRFIPSSKSVSTGELLIVTYGIVIFDDSARTVMTIEWMSYETLI